MSWTEYFDRIVVINLPHRKDRLIEVTEEMDKYGIEFELVDGIKNDNGAEGLRQTVENIFLESIEAGHRRILIFEDDAYFLEDPNPIMEQVIQQVPENFLMCFLGCQATRGFQFAYSTNLLLLQGAFATHAVMYSLQCMKEVISRGLKAPIDNFYVDEIQNMGNTYAIRPILCSQRAGMSNIGNQFIDWNPFILNRFQQKLAEL